ncbi:MAG: protocadherin, partial [Candidatus Saccharimonadales bacterium]
TYGRAGAAAGVSGATGSAVKGGSVAGYRGAGGNQGARVSRGAASSSGNRQGGSISAAQGRQGYTAVNMRGGYGAGGTGRSGSATAVVGPGGNVVSAGRGASFANGQFVGGSTWRGVNGAFNHWNWYGAGWWGGYPGAWFPGKWALATTAWATAGWALAGPYCGCDGGSPAYYDYGENVTYGDDGMVYSDGQPVATADEYYDQASNIADTGETAENEEWLPLGIFAVVVSEGQIETDKVLQLAMNNEGVIRGNYHDLMSDKVTPITGAVDKSTQRVAIKIEGNNNLVAETGLYNLTNDEAPALIHFGRERHEQRIFVRLQSPESHEADLP